MMNASSLLICPPLKECRVVIRSTLEPQRYPANVIPQHPGQEHLRRSLRKEGVFNQITLTGRESVWLSYGVSNYEAQRRVDFETVRLRTLCFVLCASCSCRVKPNKHKEQRTLKLFLHSNACSAFEKLSIARLAFELVSIDNDLAAREYGLDHALNLLSFVSIVVAIHMLGLDT